MTPLFLVKHILYQARGFALSTCVYLNYGDRGSDRGDGLAGQAARGDAIPPIPVCSAFRQVDGSPDGRNGRPARMTDHSCAMHASSAVP